MTSFITLFRGRGLKIAALLDYHADQKKMVEQLEKSRLLDDGHLLKTIDFTGTDEADIEDLLGWELYSELVNSTLNLPQGNRLPAQKPADCEKRIVKEVEKRAKLFPAGVPEFDHYSPAQYLNQLSPTEVHKLPGLASALDRFEAAFATLNDLI